MCALQHEAPRLQSADAALAAAAPHLAEVWVALPPRRQAGALLGGAALAQLQAWAGREGMRGTGPGPGSRQLGVAQASAHTVPPQQAPFSNTHPPPQILTVAPHLQVQPWKRLAHFAGSQAQNFSQKLASPAQGQSALQAPSQAQGKY